MKLVIIIGAGAVGKMTVGQELAKITDLRLYHNHIDIEPVIEVFGEFYTPAVVAVRKAMFEEFAKTDHYGMIFTYMWSFDNPFSWDLITELVDIFKQTADAEIYAVELVADQATRLARNVTENRLAHKASKRDTEVSNARLMGEDANYRLVSHDGEVPFENYFKMDNSDLQPCEVATIIKDRFSL